MNCWKRRASSTAWSRCSRRCRRSRRWSADPLNPRPFSRKGRRGEKHGSPSTAERCEERQGEGLGGGGTKGDSGMTEQALSPVETSDLCYLDPKILRFF